MIQQRVEGDFSKGGSHPRFDDRGKIWRGEGFVKNHVNQVRGRGKTLPPCYAGCDLVEYELVEAKRTPMSDFYNDHAAAKAKKEADVRQRAKEAEEAQERDLYERLHAKYGDQPSEETSDAG